MNNFKNQFGSNLISNAAFFGINIIVGIFLVPFYIKHLGVEKYGFIPLAFSLSDYVTLITTSINAAGARYLAIAIQNKNFGEGNKVFNTTFFSILGFATIMLPVVSLFAYFSPKIFNMPAGTQNEISWLFFLAMASFLISILSASFATSSYSLNRLDIQRYNNIASLFIRTTLIIAFFLVVKSSLVLVGVSQILAAIAAITINIAVWRKLTPDLHINRSDFDKKKLSLISSMSWWIAVNQIGSILFLRADLIVINLTLGTVSAGQYAALLQWTSLIRSMAAVFGGLFGPMILICYAKNDTDRLVYISRKAVKFMALIMAIPIGLLCGFSKPILHLWLGDTFAPLWPLLSIMLIHLAINVAVTPLFSINTALNKLRLPGTLTIIMGTINILLAVALIKYARLGMYGVAIAGAIVLTLKNAVFTPIYAAYILKIERTIFLKELSAGIILSLLSATAGLIAVNIIGIKSTIPLGISAGVLFAVFTSLIWFFAIDKREKELIFSIIKRGNK